MDKKNGFTLIELLVVIAILGFLAAIGTVIFKDVTAKTRDSKRMGDLQSIAQALEFYRGDNHFYPKSTGLSSFVLATSIVLDNCTGGVSDCSVKTTYLEPIPQDPNVSSNYFYSASPGSCDNLSQTTLCSSFILCAKKESTSTIYDLSACLPFNCGFGNYCNIGVSSE